MITFPKAKINFGLRITGKRPDGFHDIETIFYPVPVYDALEFVVASGTPADDDLVVTGINIATKPENNLVKRAVKKLRESHRVPFLKIHLHKAIPSGAGLGGGSSDAAFMLRTVNRYFDLNIDDNSLKDYALELGSDCPFFIDPVPSLARGRGEVLRGLNPFLEGYFMVLLNPGISISTNEAYFNTGISRYTGDLEKFTESAPSKWKKLITNDFEEFAFRLFPEIGNLKKALYRSGIFRERPQVPEKLRKYIIYEGVV
jgi:4-diphosphocytidyl-2-C-methyl-D-erythritol kinase